MSTITSLPTAPTRTDPTTFSTRADAWDAALVLLGPQINVVAGEVNAAAAAAAASAASAQSVAIAWVSGTTYAIGDVRWSPANYNTYRRKTAGAGTTDPSADSTNWAVLYNTTGITFVGATFTDYTETLYAPAAGSAFTVALANGTIQKLTTNANTTITLPSSVAGKSYTLLVAYGGAHSLTWAGGSVIKWPAGVAPTATSVNGKVDIFSFTCDGTNTYARSGGGNY